MYCHCFSVQKWVRLATVHWTKTWHTSMQWMASHLKFWMIFLEGIIPVCHLVLRIWGSFLIHFLIELTNHRSSPSMTFNSKDTTGGNAFENWSLLRLLPLLIAHDILEGDHAWVILMLLNDILELVMLSHFTDSNNRQCVLRGRTNLSKNFFLKSCAWHSIGTYLGLDSSVFFNPTLEIDKVMLNVEFRLLLIYKTKHTGMFQKTWSIVFWKSLLKQFKNLILTQLLTGSNLWHLHSSVNIPVSGNHVHQMGISTSKSSAMSSM